METDLKKFEQWRKNTIANTMETGRGLWQLGMEELWRAVSGSKKPVSKSVAKNQISAELDKYETSRIDKHKNK
jgi:hypothetical protein